MSWIFFLTNMTAGGVALFGPTIVAGIYPDYSTVRQQLMTVVSQSAKAIALLSADTLWHSTAAIHSWSCGRTRILLRQLEDG